MIGKKRLLSGFIFIILSILPMGGMVYAEEIDSFSPPLEKEAKAPPELKLKDKGGTQQSVQLAPPSDLEIQTLKENNSKPDNSNENPSAKGKALQIGFGRAVPLAFSNSVAPQQLNWQTLATGGLATQFTVTSPTAAALRIALAVKKMPPGVELRFVGSNRPSVVLGPVTSDQVLTQTPYWSPIVEGESLTMEIYLPPGVTPGDLDFSLVMTSHLLSFPAKLNLNSLQPKAASAACQLDAVCYYNTAGVQSIASAVASMSYTKPNGLSYVCTGTLLNSRTPGVPYFYSANHCISDQATASTLNTYWFWESAACNSATSSPQLTALINGATLLYNDAVSDVLLLRLNDPAPAGATFAGWNTTPVVAGTAFIGLHHPVGDLRKISLGTTTGQIVGSGNIPNGGGYTSIVNSQGITEGGSSGSGLFVLSNTSGQYQLRGGLWGGGSSCTNPSATDYYSRFDLAYPNISGYLNLEQTDMRTYVPAAAASGGYFSYLRVINKGDVPTPITVTVVDGPTGVTGATGTLTASLPAQAAITYSAQQVEAALGVTLLASDRPRIRVFANTPIEAQSFLQQPGGILSEVSNARGNASTIAVRNYVPVAMAASGYVSYLRVVNTGTAATPVTVARIDPVTGLTGTAGMLTASLPAKAAITYTATQVEAALGSPITATERPRILVSGVDSQLDVQTFLLQPGGAFTNHSSGRTGNTIDVPNYVPAAVTGYTSYIRVINGGATAAPVTVAVLDDVTGAVGPSAVLIPSLPANAAMTLTSTQVEAALGTQIPAANRPRIRISSSVLLAVQSFLLQPGGAFNEISDASSGTSVDVRTYIPAADAGAGYTSYLRVINSGIVATPVTVALVDGVTGAVGSTSTLIASLPAGGAITLTSSQVESALGAPIASGSRPRIRITGNTVLEVQSFLTQPGGAFAEVSGGQSGPN